MKRFWACDLTIYWGCITQRTDNQMENKKESEIEAGIVLVSFWGNILVI